MSCLGRPRVVDLAQDLSDRRDGHLRRRRENRSGGRRMSSAILLDDSPELNPSTGAAGVDVKFFLLVCVGVVE